MSGTAVAPPVRVVLYEGEGSRPLESEDRYRIAQTLLEKGYAVTRTTSGGTVSAAANGELLVLGQFSVEEASRAPLPVGEGLGRGPSSDGLAIREIAGMDPDAVVSLVESRREETLGPRPPHWKPWFPVIDYDRCTNCMQCLSFCLFDVYGVQNGKIQVRNQNNCKTDCPACSRVCPEVAILFPKYRSGPINGDEIDPEDLRREAMKVDISALLGGDIYAALRDRSVRAKSRFSKERDEDRALKERQRCLIQLQKDMDIPPEVLASLPSPEEIRTRAEQAKARAEAARSGVE